MIAIKDMEMPKCCHWDCPLCNEDGGACMLGAYDPKTDTKKERAKDCHLVEIITCENCNNHGINKEHPDIDGARYCSVHRIYTGYDYYCGDGERRE